MAASHKGKCLYFGVEIIDLAVTEILVVVFLVEA